MSRPQTAGPDDGPVSPFPIKLTGNIIKGFGRGSKQLGIPTANLPIGGLDVGGHTDIASGVYFAWVGLNMATATSDITQATESPGSSNKEAGAQNLPLLSHSEVSHSAAVYQAVLSIGYNPVFGNKKRSVEVHIIHEFSADFYNALLNLSIVGFIRPEQNYSGVDALIEDIRADIEVSKRSLARPAYERLKSDPFLMDFSWAT